MKFSVRFTPALRVATVATALAMVVGVVQLTNATGDFTPAQVPSASAPPATIGASPGQPLSQAALDNAARAFAVGLPSYWREETPPVADEGTTYAATPACPSSATPTSTRLTRRRSIPP